MKRQPLVSVVVLNYNAKDMLRKCLESALRTKYNRFQIIAVDNGSTDSSVSTLMSLAKRSRRIRVIVNQQNLGFAEGNNTALAKCRGKYIVLLNSDTVVTPSWLGKLVKVAEADPRIGAAQSKLLLPDSAIDSVGSFLTQFGYLYHQYVDEPDPGFRGTEQVFSAKAAALLLRRDLVKRIGLFDPDYFTYVEETDLCWRIWLSGYRVVVVHGSVVHHRWGGTVTKLPPRRATYLFCFHGTKNYIQTLIKNASGQHLVQILPMHLLFRLVEAGVLIVRGKALNGFYMYKAMIWILLNFKRIWAKRLLVQTRIRTVSDDVIWPKVMRRISFSYFIKFFAKYLA